MKYNYHDNNDYSIAEFVAENTVLTNAQQFLQMIMDSRAEAIVVHQEDIDPAFFDLQTGLAGEMLQKVVNYRLRLAIVGDFSVYKSSSLKAFIIESNRSESILFVETIGEALRRLRR